MEEMYPITQQLLIFLLGATTLHGFFLSIVIYTKGKQNRANNFLVFTLLALSFYLLNYLLFLTSFIKDFPHLLNVFYVGIFLIGPGFYFFVKSNLDKEFKWSLIDGLHLLPIIHYLWNSISIFRLTTSQKNSIIEQIFHPEGHFTWWDILTGSYPMFLLMGYVIAAWLLLHKRKEIDSPIKNIKKIAHLKSFCIVLAGLIFLDLLLRFIAFSISTPIFTVEYILAALLAIIIHLISYIFLEVPSSKFPINEKYKTSSLNKPQIQIYQRQVLNLLKEDQLWMQPNLKIADLAKKLNIPPHQLSQILSEGLQTNFFDLINQYRIEEIKRRLVQPAFRHYSILAIALDCGFNNKATFNRVFKKMTGMTPSAFAGNVSS